jgi:hypothetical protein
MHIDYAATLVAIKTIPVQGSETNICKKVYWEVRFFETTHPESVFSIAQVESHLDTDALADPFTAFPELTQQQVLQWSLDAQGGDQFLTELLAAGHEERMARQFDDIGLLDADLSSMAES